MSIAEKFAQWWKHNWKNADMAKAYEAGYRQGYEDAKESTQDQLIQRGDR